MQVMAQMLGAQTRSRCPQVTTANEPSVVLHTSVDPADRMSVIDFINRVNWIFDSWRFPVRIHGPVHALGSSVVT
jgi:hypothetical protein